MVVPYEVSRCEETVKPARNALHLHLMVAWSEKHVNILRKPALMVTR